METKLKQLLKTIKLNESMLSMLFGVVTVVLVGVLVVRMYNSAKPELTLDGDKTEIASEKIGDVAVEVGEDGKKYPSELPSTYKVEKGDHLWKIATKLYGSGYNWVDIAKENGLKNASSIEVGQELKLPKAAVITLEKPITPAVAEVMPRKATTIEGDKYTVVKGDYLWNIAVAAYGDGYKWVAIAKANEIDLRKANYIEIGQELKLPR